MEDKDSSLIKCKRSKNERHLWILPEPGKGVDMVGRCKHCGRKKGGFVNFHVYEPSWVKTSEKAKRLAGVDKKRPSTQRWYHKR